jgi:hypothetical protein
MKSDEFAVQDLIDSGVKLERCQSPHSTIWENKHYTFAQKRSGLIKFVIGAILYMVVSSLIILGVKDYLSNLRFTYSFHPFCPEINSIFGGNTTT